MDDNHRDAECRELAVQVKATGSGFISHKHLVGQGELFLHEANRLNHRISGPPGNDRRANPLPG